MRIPTRLLWIAAGLLAWFPSSGAAQPQWGERHRDDHGALIRIARDYDLGAGNTLTQPLFLIGGSARLDGTVNEDVLVIGGEIRVGPTAVIRGDLTTVGGDIVADPAARISGRFEELNGSWPRGDWLGASVGDGWWAWAALATTMLRLSLVTVVGLLLAIVAPDWARRIGRRASDAPGLSWLAGAGAELLLIPAAVALAVILAVSLIGIPLLPSIPLLLALFGALWVVGFSAVAGRVGAAIRRGDGDTSSPALDFLIGLVVLATPTLLAHLLMVSADGLRPIGVVVGTTGLVVEYVAWTIGLGAVLATLRRGPLTATPPPLPPSSGLPDAGHASVPV